jgi:hypothetical protein
MRSTTSIFLAAALVGTTVAGAATARADRYELAVGAGARWTPSASVDAVTDAHVQPTFALRGAVRLDPLRLPGLDLLGELGVEGSSLTGTVFQQVASSVSVLTARVGGRLEHRRGRLSAFGRAGAGYTTSLLQLGDEYSGAGRMIRDRAHDLSANIGAGIGADLLHGRPFSLLEGFRFGVRAELEYDQTSPLAFQATPATDPGDLSIPTRPASLGELDISGWTLRLSAYGRF